MTNVEVNQCVWVKGPNGTRVECTVKEILPCLFSIFAQVGVQATHGGPFNGQNIAVVPMSRIFASEGKVQS